MKGLDVILSKITGLDEDGVRYFVPKALMVIAVGAFSLQFMKKCSDGLEEAHVKITNHSIEARKLQTRLDNLTYGENENKNKSDLEIKTADTKRGHNLSVSSAVESEKKDIEEIKSKAVEGKKNRTFDVNATYAVVGIGLLLFFVASYIGARNHSAFINDYKAMLAEALSKAKSTSIPTPSSTPTFPSTASGLIR